MIVPIVATRMWMVSAAMVIIRQTTFGVRFSFSSDHRRRSPAVVVHDAEHGRDDFDRLVSCVLREIFAGFHSADHHPHQRHRYQVLLPAIHGLAKYTDRRFVEHALLVRGIGSLVVRVPLQALFDDLVQQRARDFGVVSVFRRPNAELGQSAHVASFGLSQQLPRDLGRPLPLGYASVNMYIGTCFLIHRLFFGQIAKCYDEMLLRTAISFLSKG
jgi:hypothetical protein